MWGVVDGAPITRAEVDKYYRTQLNPDAPQPSQDEALSLKLNVLDELINNHILLEKAKTLGLQAADGEVEDKFTEFKSPYTEEEFQRQLKARDYTVDDLRNDIRQQLSIQKVINHEVVAKITVTDQDVQDFYNQNRAQFNVTEPQYRIAQIVVTPHKDPGLRNRKNDDATTDAEAKRKAAALEQQLSTGADFAQVAMDYSEDPASAGSGGDLGYVPESSLSQSDPALKKTVMSLKPGQISGVIVLRDSYRILKLVSQGSARAAGSERSVRAAVDSRQHPQSQGTVAARRVSGYRAEQRKDHELSCPASGGIGGEIARRRYAESGERCCGLSSKITFRFLGL